MVIIMWARIENGTVAEITEIDPTGRFHPSMNWVACGAGVFPGWTYDGLAFAEPLAAQITPPTRAQVEAQRLRAYAEPLTGSDRYFAEAQREALIGNAEAAEAAKALGLARFAEIQAEYPWPAE
jgi:hypothetical protein